LGIREGKAERRKGGKGVYHALAWQRETNAIILKSLQPKRTINKKFHQKIREIRKSEKSAVQTMREF